MRKSSTSATTASALDVLNQSNAVSSGNNGNVNTNASNGKQTKAHGVCNGKQKEFSQVSSALSRGFMQVDEAFSELFAYQNAFAFHNMDTLEKFGDYVQRGKGHGDGGPTEPCWREKRFQPMKFKTM